MSINKIQQLFVLSAIVFFTILIRVPTIYAPWGGDQGTFGYIADGMLAGKIPYKDMYTSSGYGLYFLYMLFFKIFGNHMAALNFGDLLSAISAVMLVYFLAGYLFGNECAIISGLLAAVFGSGKCFSYLVDMQGAWGTYWQLAQRESFMLPLITAAFFLFFVYDLKKSGVPYIIAGILMGLSAALKFTSLGICILLTIYLFLADVWHKEGLGFKIFLVKALCFFIGISIVQLPFLYYFWVSDSLSMMYDAVFVHTSIYAKLSRGNIIANAFMGNSFIFNQTIMLWVFALAALVFLMGKKRSRINFLLLTWTVGTLLSIWGQGKFFGYHFILIIAPLSVLAGFGLINFLKTENSWARSISSARYSLTQICLWVFILYNAASFVWDHYDYYKWSALYGIGKLSKSQYYDVYNEYPLHNYSFRANNDIVHYLKDTASSNASLRTINGGGDTVIHYLAGLKSSTRFTSTWYLFNPNLYSDPITTKLRTEFLDGIRQEKPDYILLVYYDMAKFREVYSDRKFQDTIQMLDYIEKEYSLEKTFRDGRTLYRKKA